MTGGSPRSTLAVPDHELLRVIGHGAYGEVWLARNALGAYRAVKVVYRKDFEDSRPFEREFRGIQKFEPISRSHEGLVHILQVGRRQEYFYYVMELADAASAERGVPNAECTGTGVEGGSLSTPHSALRTPHSYAPRTLREDLRRHGRLPAERCVEIGLALTSALAYLHKHGLVHRDIKPSNIILVGEKPKLADIGLVTDAGDSQSIVGTEGYLPPEGPGTPQADIFSLGKVLYEISTGQDRTHFPDLSPELKDWPDRETLLELNEIVLKACAQDAAYRYGSAQEMFAELSLLESGRSLRRRRALHHRWRALGRPALVSVVLVLGLAGGRWALRRAPEPYPLSKIPEVNTLVSQGNHCVIENFSEEGISNAVAFFNRAIQLDASYLPARFGLYIASSRRALLRGPVPSPEMRSTTLTLAQLAPGSVEALTASSFVKWFDGDFAGARADAWLATQRRGASVVAEAGARLYYGYFLLESGVPPKQALREFQVAERLYAQNPFVYQHLGNAYAALGNYDEALKYYSRCLEMENRHYPARARMAQAYEAMTNFTAAIEQHELFDKATGQFDERKQQFYNQLRAVVLEKGARGYWSKWLEFELKKTHPEPYYLGCLYMCLGDKDAAYTCLTKACKKGTIRGGLLTDPWWDKHDPRVVALATSIGLFP